MNHFLSKSFFSIDEKLNDQEKICVRRAKIGDAVAKLAAQRTTETEVLFLCDHISSY